MGLLLAVVVLPANLHDHRGALGLFATLLKSGFGRLVQLFADSAYAGYLEDVAHLCCSWTLAIVRRRKEAQGFEVQPKRWIVERIFGWLGRYRRLSKDYEGCTQSSEATVRLAMIHRMLCRLAPS